MKAALSSAMLSIELEQNQTIAVSDLVNTKYGMFKVTKIIRVTMRETKSIVVIEGDMLEAQRV